MDRRPLQLAAAFLLLAGILGVSTALVSEMREELLAAQEGEPDLQLDAPADGSSGLPITEFTLLDPAEASLAGARRAGDVVHLVRNGTLFFDEGDSIQVKAIDIPPGSQATLLGTGTLRGNVLACTQGCILVSEDGRLVTPLNATIVLPPGTRLPLEQGDVPRGTTVDLPPGTNLVLAPITMMRPTQLPLGIGTTIVLPAGAGDRVPPPGISQGQFVLPRDTQVRGALGDPLSDEAARELLRNQAGDQAAAPPSQTAPPAHAIIEVTRWPDSISKGVPFQVGGTVHTPDGAPSVGHPVTVYANASKDRPGFEIQLGEVRTGPDGNWTAQARIPPERPTRPYHIVAEAHERLDIERPLLRGWSDPIVDVDAEPRLVLRIPAQEGARVPVALQARLEDEHGAAVPNQEVVLSVVDGTFEERATTDENGEVLVVHRSGFPTAGTYEVAARFDGTDHLAPAESRAAIEIVEARIDTVPTILVPRGSAATLPGRVLVESNGDAGRVVQARFANLQAEATTDASGHFELAFHVPAGLEIGNYTMRLTTLGVTASRTVIVTVTGQTVLAAAAPSVAPLGGTLRLEVAATDELGTPLRGLTIAARAPGGSQTQALTDEQGVARVPVGLSILGKWDLTLSTRGTPLLASNKTLVPLHVGPLTVAGDVALTPGTPRNVTLALSVNGEPLAGLPAEVRGQGYTARTETDPAGLAHYTLVAPTSLAPGPTDAAVYLPTYNLLHQVPARVLTTPRLSVDVLQQGADGEEVVVRVVASDGRGFLEGVPVVVHATGAMEAREQAITGKDGSALVTLSRPRNAEGTAVLTVQAQETSSTAPALRIAQAQLTPAPFPWLWFAPLALLITGAYALRQYRVRPARVPRPAPTIELRIAPQLGTGLPPVWHGGEPTALDVRLLDTAGEPIPGAVVHLRGPGVPSKVTLDGEGRATVDLPAGAGSRRRVLYEASFDGEGPHRASEASLELRLVDYREEIDREYRALREEAAERGLCGTDATPHELARAYGNGDHARRMALVFERCDYSLHPVDRSHYEEFMKAKQRCQGHGAGS